MYIDDTLAAGVGTAFTAVSGGIAWFVGKIIKINGKVQGHLKESNESLVDMLRLQLTDNDRRRDLWDKVKDSIGDNATATKNLEKEFQWLRTEIQRGLRP